MVSSLGVAPAGSVSSFIGTELDVFSSPPENIIRAFLKQSSEHFFVRCLIFECHGSHGVLELLESHGACPTSEYFFERLGQSWLNR